VDVAGFLAFGPTSALVEARPEVLEVGFGIGQQMPHHHQHRPPTSDDGPVRARDARSAGTVHQEGVRAPDSDRDLTSTEAS